VTGENYRPIEIHWQTFKA